MASNDSGAGVSGVAQDHFEFANYPAHGAHFHQWNSIAAIESPDQQQMHQQFSSSSIPSYNHTYHHNSSQPQYQAPPSYYQPNPVPEVAYERAYHYPAPSQNFQSFHSASMASQYRNDFVQTYHHQFGDIISIESRPYEESPMQRMQQLTQQQYGGPLAAQSAAAVAADATQAARRISPPRRKRSLGEEETVRAVLHRQYIEQKRLREEQMQQMQQQQLLQQVVPNSHPATLDSTSQSAHPRIPRSLSSAPSNPPPPPPTQATPTFPFVPQIPLHSRTPPLPADDDSSSSSNLITDRDVSQQAMVARLKQWRMTSLDREQTEADSKTAEAVSTEGAPVPATVVQSKETIPLSSSRKRSLDEPNGDSSEAGLKPGMRREFNQKGKAVERLYVLVHHCNHNDPEYNPEGVLMPFDEYKKEEKRDDMITFSYSSVAAPYEYVDFRVKKQGETLEERVAACQP